MLELLQGFSSVKGIFKNNYKHHEDAALMTWKLPHMHDLQLGETNDNNISKYTGLALYLVFLLKTNYPHLASGFPHQMRSR